MPRKAEIWGIGQQIWNSGAIWFFILRDYSWNVANSEPLPMHPNKHIREALKYAEEHGWRIIMSKGHAFCRILCGYGHGDCQKSVWSTPRNPEQHARDIRKKVDSCPGA